MAGRGLEDPARVSRAHASANEDGLGRLSIRAALLDCHGLGHLAPGGRGVRFLRLADGPASPHLSWP